MYLTVEKTYIIALNEEERRWLHSIMQNPLCGDEETTHDQTLRERLFSLTEEK